MPFSLSPWYRSGSALISVLGIFVALTLSIENTTGDEPDEAELPNASLPSAPPPGVDDPAGTASDETKTTDSKPVSYWVEQLGSDQFLRRQSASMRLLQAGDAAVEPLAEIATQGQLEVTERAVSLLETLALKQKPNDEMGAFGALTRLLEAGSGSASMRAKVAMDEIHRSRETEAFRRLSAAGLKLGYREFVIDARSVNDNVVWIDSSWNGDVESLHWLKWLTDVTYAIVEGEAVTSEVVGFVVQLPMLRTLAIREAKLESDVLGVLEKMPRVDELEFRYVTLTPKESERISKLPIRVQLVLMGTDLPAESIRSLRESMPGLSIVAKQGGFLGVKCNSFAQACQIESLIQGGAAEAAGLQPGDIVTAIGDTNIQRFEDLQATVGDHLAGDELDITVDRRGEVKKVKVTLMRMSRTD